MKTHIFQAVDTRQTIQWGKYLSQLGWNIEHVGKTVVLIKKIPFINKSVIKIQHPLGPIPFKEIEKIAKKYSAFSTLIEPHNVKYSEQDYKKNKYAKSNMRFAHSATIKIDLTQSEKKIMEHTFRKCKTQHYKSQKKQSCN